MLAKEHGLGWCHSLQRPFRTSENASAKRTKSLNSHRQASKLNWMRLMIQQCRLESPLIGIFPAQANTLLKTRKRCDFVWLSIWAIQIDSYKVVARITGSTVFAATALISTCREGSCHKSSSVGTHPASSPAFLGASDIRKA